LTVFDVFPFFNELDLLEIRLNTLASSVDYFVISEATYTFSGKPKPLYLSENIHRFEEFIDRIHVNILDLPPRSSAFETEWQQRNVIQNKLRDLCQSEDIIIFGDADEIPQPKSLPEALDIAAGGRMAHFAQNLYYYYVNLEEVSGTLLSACGEFPDITLPKWLGSKACSYERVRHMQLDDLRQPGSKHGAARIAEGGWHFSFVGSDRQGSPEERIKAKIQAYGHQEYNNFRTLRKIKGNVKRTRDIFGRSSALFAAVPIDDSFPEYLSKNQSKFANLILPVEGK